MRECILAERYARALIKIGMQENQVPLFKMELTRAEETMQKVPDLALILSNRDIEPAKRKAIIQKLGHRLNLSPTMLKFLQLLIDRERFYLFPEILQATLRLAMNLENRAVAHVKVVGAPFTREGLEELKQVLGRLTGRQIQMELEEDEAILGGIQIQVGDKIYDGSVRGELERLCETLAGG